MMECGAVPQQVPDRPDGTGLVIESAEDDSVDPRADEGPGAHCARLQGDDERAAVQAPLPPRRGRSGDRHELGVAERIGIDLPPIVTAPDDLTVPVDDDGTDGNVVMSRGEDRLGEGMPHPFAEPGRGRSGQRAASS